MNLHTISIVASGVLARTLFAGAALALIAGAAGAQSTGDPVAGKLLYDDTPNQSGNQALNACNNCHSVESRRQLISGSQFGPLGFDTAKTRLVNAISANTGGMGQFSVLSQQQVDNLAGYLADTPKTSYTQLDFAPSAVNVSESFPLDLTNGATSATVRVSSVAISGTNASNFTLTADACTSQNLTANATCRVTVRFVSSSTGGKSATLTFALDPSNSTSNYTREVTLTGAVAVASPAPTPSPTPAGESGGGGLDWPWLAALAAAVVAARQTTRRPR